jgi:hypothetical protein
MSDGAHAHARPRYLIAKRSVDERARNRRVRDRLVDSLPDRPRVVEAGSGAGFSVPTLREWGVDPAAYRGVDTDPGIVAFARHLVPRLCRRRGVDATDTATGCRLGDAPVAFEAGDALAALPGADADLLYAGSFLDLVPLDEALDAVDAALAPGGLAYAPFTFDGVTLFQPTHPADERVVDAYHDAIDATPGRTSRAGRDLLDRLRRRPGELLAVGASDWVVRPVDDGYPADERSFLASILEFVADSLDDVAAGDEWLAARRRQLSAGELTFVAHGYDLLWRSPA